jgi:hypothetical protein
MWAEFVWLRAEMVSREVVIGSGRTFGFHKRRGISEQTSQERLWYFACLLSAFISL